MDNRADFVVVKISQLTAYYKQLNQHTPLCKGIADLLSLLSGFLTHYGVYHSGEHSTPAYMTKFQNGYFVLPKGDFSTVKNAKTFEVKNLEHMLNFLKIPPPSECSSGPKYFLDQIEELQQKNVELENTIKNLKHQLQEQTQQLSSQQATISKMESSIQETKVLDTQQYWTESIIEAAEANMTEEIHNDLNFSEMSIQYIVDSQPIEEAIHKVEQADPINSQVVSPISSPELSPHPNVVHNVNQVPDDFSLELHNPSNVKSGSRKVKAPKSYPEYQKHYQFGNYYHEKKIALNKHKTEYVSAFFKKWIKTFIFFKNKFKREYGKRVFFYFNFICKLNENGDFKIVFNIKCHYDLDKAARRNLIARIKGLINKFQEKRKKLISSILMK